MSTKRTAVESNNDEQTDEDSGCKLIEESDAWITVCYFGALTEFYNLL